MECDLIFFIRKNPSKMLNVGNHRVKLLQICNYCKKVCTISFWNHDQECEKMPQDKKKLAKLQLFHETLAPSVEKDWKDFIERKFEPHTFRARWKNIMCPYCFEDCKDIYHTFVCPFTPEERKQVNKKIAFWKGT